MSSSLRAALDAIDIAIRECIEGQIGTTRTVEQGKFKYAEFIGHPIERQQRLASEITFGGAWFDLEFVGIRDAESRPISRDSNLGHKDVTVRIEFIRYVLHRSTIDSGISRDSVLDFICDLHDVEQALGKPGNLSTTTAGAATDMADGCVGIEAPAIQSIQRDWERHLLRSEMTVVAQVPIVQET